MRRLMRQRHSSVSAGGFGALFVLAVGLTACGGTGVNRGDINVVSIEEEWELGRQLEQDIARELTLVDDPAVLRYLNEVGNRIVDQTQMAELPWKFHAVRDDELNAFNTPGGHVYVNTGLIAAADSASELVGVMSHEIAHGVARHATEQMTRAYGLNVIAAVVLGEDPATYQQILAQIIGAGTIARFSREAEEEADRLGVRYMYDAGYDPEGLAAFFEELLSRHRERRGAIEDFFATHPLTEDRIRYIRELAAELPPKANLTRDEAGFRRIRDRVQ